MNRAVRVAAFVAALGGALSCALLLVPGAADAKAFAAMKEQPVGGGELRLATPRSMSAREAGVAASDERIDVTAFPLKHTKVDVDVEGAVSYATVEQTFDNPFNEPIEAIYVFPLGDDAAVHDYEIVVGDRVIKGHIDTKEAARKTYETAKEEGHTAGLLEEQKANVFQQSVANIPPHQTVIVRFRYVELLNHSDGMFELVYPMVVGPRYLPATTSDPRPVGSRAWNKSAPAGAASSANAVVIPYVPPAMRPANDIEVNVRIDASVPLARVESPTHRIVTTKVDETTTSVTLDTADRIPNKDFVLRFTGAGEATQVGMITHRDASGPAAGSGYFTMLVQPKAEYRTGDITPREVVLVIDVSGSMSGEPLEHAKVIGQELLASLGPKDTFNCISFASGTAALSEQPIGADAAGVAKGQQWLSQLQSGGGTEMGAGLMRSFLRAPGDDRVRIIYVMTDGFIGNDEEIVSIARKTPKVNRVFPIGIGSAPNRYLMDRLGEVGRGFTTYVTRNEDLQAVVEQIVTRTTQPYLTDVTVDWGGLAVKDVTPELIPDVYAGRPIVIAGRYDRPGSGTVKISARTGGRTVVTELPVTLPAQDNHPAVAQLWARRKIHELELDNDNDSRRAEIEKLGLGFSLLTPYTSFVAVDERKVVADGKVVKTIVQPVEVPDGVSFDDAVQQDPQGGSYSGGSSSSSGGGFNLGLPSGGGGDVDPFTLVTIGSFLPLAWALRKRRKEQRA